MVVRVLPPAALFPVTDWCNGRGSRGHSASARLLVLLRLTPQSAALVASTLPTIGLCCMAPLLRLDLLSPVVYTSGIYFVFAPHQALKTSQMEGRQP